MEMIVTCWTKVAEEAQASNVANFFKGRIACKEKWMTMYGDYKKLADYKGAIDKHKDYYIGLYVHLYCLLVVS
jgi:hypothetical protein